MPVFQGPTALPHGPLSGVCSIEQPTQSSCAVRNTAAGVCSSRRRRRSSTRGLVAALKHVSRGGGARGQSCREPGEACSSASSPSCAAALASYRWAALRHTGSRLRGRAGRGGAGESREGTEHSPAATPAWCCLHAAATRCLFNPAARSTSLCRPSDSKKKKAALKKGGSKSSLKGSASAGNLNNENGGLDANGVAAALEEFELNDRSTTGVLTSHPQARDIHFESFSLLYHGHELLQDTTIELNYGRWVVGGWAVPGP